jgi:hypothetical protein
MNYVYTGFLVGMDHEILQGVRRNKLWNNKETPDKACAESATKMVQGSKSLDAHTRCGENTY